MKLSKNVNQLLGWNNHREKRVGFSGVLPSRWIETSGVVICDKRKERNELLLSLVSEKIPDIKEILQELQKELAEEVKKQILELEF